MHWVARLVAVCALGGLVVTATQGVATTVTTGQQRESVQPVQDLHGLDPSTVAFLWSLDSDTGTPGTAGVPVYEAFATNEAFDGLLRAATSTDRVHSTPPSHAATWTAGEFGELAAQEYSGSTAVRPQGATETDGEYIRDAHATVFSVTPSTVVLDGSGPTRHIAPEGRVRALLDYRVQTPRNRTVTPEADRIVERRIESFVVEHGIERIDFLVDGRLVAQRSGDRASHTPTFDYDVGSDAERLTVRATYTVTVNRTVTTTKRVPAGDQPRPKYGVGQSVDTQVPVETPAGSTPAGTFIWNPSNARDATDHDGGSAERQGRPQYSPTPTSTPSTPSVPSTESPPPTSPSPPDDEEDYRTVTVRETEIITKTVTVSTTVPVHVYELPSTIEGHHASTAGRAGDGYAVIADGHRWGGFRVGDEVVKNRWGYLTARNPAWDALVISSDGEETRQLSPAIPVSVYAVPLNRSPDVEGASQSAVLDSWGSSRTHTGAPSAFSVDTPPERYSGISGIAARLHHSTVQTAEAPATDEPGHGSGPKPVTVFGLVRGVDRTISATALETRTVYDADLELSVDRTTASSTYLTVRLEATDDTAPISLQQSNNPRIEPIRPNEADEPTAGVVVVESLRTGETWHLHPVNGTQTLEVDTKGAFTAEYRPASWQVAGPAYQPATSGTTALDWTIQSTLDWIVVLVISFAPFAGLYYAFGGLERIFIGNPRE